MPESAPCTSSAIPTASTLITSAEITGQDVVVGGFVYARDFPEVVRELKASVLPGDQGLGMSYELADAAVEDVKAAVWKLVEVTFTGAAVLKRKKAAYGRTAWELSK